MKKLFDKIFSHFNSEGKNNLYTGLSFFIAIPPLILAIIANNKADEAIRTIQIQKNEIKILQSQIIEINNNISSVNISNKEGQVNTVSGGKVENFSPVNK